MGSNSNLLNRLDSAVGMRLAYWAYEHEDVAKAEALATYPTSWVHAGLEHLPSGFQEGWNTQRNASGKLENQFKVSINESSKEITFDFKGSDAWSNWKSDLGNAGASEFAKIQAKAQAVFDALSKDERYQGYRFVTTGHSLGGGMAQSFALKNDIATYCYEGFRQDQYLSRHVPPGPTMLPGSSLPAPLKTVLMVSGSDSLVAGPVMANDHANKALVDGQQGLSVGKDGRFLIPEGHADFAQLPPEARKLFARLSESPVVKTICSETRGPSSPCDKFTVTREDGSR